MRLFWKRWVAALKWTGPMRHLIPNRVHPLTLALVVAPMFLSGCAPPGARALLEGEKLLKKGQTQAAVEKLKTATLLLGSTNAYAFNYLGLAYHAAGQSAEAEKAYRRALFLNSNLAEARFNLGCLFLDENRLEQAKTELTAYTLRRPNSIEGWLELGTAQWRARENTSAEKSFGEALRLNPHCAEALSGIGLARLKRDRAAEAADFFTRALKAQPDYRSALLNLAITAQQNLNDLQLACEMYQRYLALKPPPDEGEAVQAILSQLQQEIRPPSRPLGTSNVTVTTKLTAGNTTRALNSVHPETTTALSRPTTTPIPPKPAVESKNLSQPVTSTTLTSGATPEGAAGAPPPEATNYGGSRYTYLSPAPPSSGNRPEAQRLYSLGFKAQREHRLPDAIQSYKQSIQQDPSYYDSYYNLGWAAAQGGNLPTAFSAYETALVLKPESADARYNFALLLKQANFTLDSANELQKLLSFHPNESRAHLALGNIYAQQFGQADKARIHYLKVLETDPRSPQAAAIRDWLSQHP